MGGLLLVGWSNEKGVQKVAGGRRQMESFPPMEKRPRKKDSRDLVGWRVSPPSIPVLHYQSIFALIIRRAMGIFDPKKPEN